MCKIQLEPRKGAWQVWGTYEQLIDVCIHSWAFEAARPALSSGPITAGR